MSSTVLWLDKSLPKGTVEICVSWVHKTFSFSSCKSFLQIFFSKIARPCKLKGQDLNEHTATANWNLIQVLWPGCGSAWTGEEEMSCMLSLPPQSSLHSPGGKHHVLVFIFSGWPWKQEWFLAACSTSSAQAIFFQLLSFFPRLTKSYIKAVEFYKNQ